MYRKSFSGLLAVIMFLASAVPVFMGCTTTWSKMKKWAGYLVPMTKRRRDGSPRGPARNGDD